jgi:hypothetical protein
MVEANATKVEQIRGEETTHFGSTRKGGRSSTPNQGKMKEDMVAGSRSPLLFGFKGNFFGNFPIDIH